MNKFQIGRIEGDWLNFEPPIHGGVFRSYTTEIESDGSHSEGELPQLDPISLDGTRPPSPSSSLSCGEDQGFLMDPSIRRRKYGSYEGSSASSITSVSGEDKHPLRAVAAREIEIDLAKYPSLDRATQKHIIQRYRDLDQNIRKEGLYNCRYYSYLIELARYLAFLGTSLFFLRVGWYQLSGLFMGIFWHQISFTAHDAGHMGITHDFTIDTCIGIFLADICGGLSLGWWKLSHNVRPCVPHSIAYHTDSPMLAHAGSPHYHKRT